MNVLVLDPNGAVLPGANVTLTPDRAGRDHAVQPRSSRPTAAAVFKTTIPATVPGKGEIAVIVDTTDYGQITAQVPLTFH